MKVKQDSLKQPTLNIHSSCALKPFHRHSHRENFINFVKFSSCDVHYERLTVVTLLKVG